MDKFILNVISPHRDDVALSLTKTLHHLIQLNVHVNIISCFTITNWAPFLSTQLTIDEISLIREKEDILYRDLLGGSVALFNLKMLDAPLREDNIQSSQSGYAIFGISVIGSPVLERFERYKKMPILIKNQNNEVWAYGSGKVGMASLTKLESDLYIGLPFSDELKQFSVKNISEAIYDNLAAKGAHTNRPNKPSNEILTGPVRAIISEIKKKLIRFQDQNAVWAIPLALGHRDHFIARLAALSSTNGSPFIFYEDMPYALHLPEEEIISHTNDLSINMSNPLKSHTLNTIQNIEQWCRAIACYRSQFSNEQIISIVSKLEERGGERLWVTQSFYNWYGRLVEYSINNKNLIKELVI